MEILMDYCDASAASWKLATKERQSLSPVCVYITRKARPMKELPYIHNYIIKDFHENSM